MRHEVQYLQVVHRIAFDATVHDAGIVQFEALRRELLPERHIQLRSIGDDADVGRVALIA